MSENMRVILAVVGIIAAIAVYSMIKKRVNLKKAAAGGDKQRMREAVSQVLPGESGYNVAYAHWERSEYHGRRTTTYYYTYALAFDATRLWVVPLKETDGVIDPGRPIMLTKDDLGMVEAADRESKGKLWRVSLTLRDKGGKDFLNCNVDVENTREDRFHHYNIIQEEECAQFSRFITSLAGQVAAENPDIQEHVAKGAIAANAGQAKKARIMGIIGLCLFFFPFISIIFGAVGLLIAPKPKETDGKPTSPFVLTLLSLLVGIAVSVGFVVLIVGQ